MKHHVMSLTPSYMGVKGTTAKNLDALGAAAEEAGHLFQKEFVERMPLDLARNECTTMFLASNATAALWVDDDCQVDPPWLPKALSLLEEEGIGIVSAPCRLRGEKVVFNILQSTPPVLVRDQRVVECIWTGLGCVLMKREVLETLHSSYRKLHYRSWLMPERDSCAIFRSEIVPLGYLATPESDENPDVRVYILDDRIFSLRARAIGLKIHAAIDVETSHEGYRGSYGAMLDEHNARQASKALKPADGFAEGSGI